MEEIDVNNIASYIEDTQKYCEHFLKIVDKKSRLIALVSNKNQLIADAILDDLESRGVPVRILFLKGRQEGISTWASSRQFKRTATRRYQRALVIAHDLDSTNNIFGMHKTYYENLPNFIRPKRTISNRKEMIFASPIGDSSGLNSVIRVETAGKGTAGRSGTYIDVHCSEFAYWTDASTVRTSLFQSVPIDGGIIVIESTANGMTGVGGEFYKMWQEAKAGLNDFIPVFLPWYNQDEYELAGEWDGKHDDRYGDEDLYLEKLTEIFGKERAVKKLLWRRHKIRNDMGGGMLSPLEQFKQEYPFTPDEAFLSSGRPVFDSVKLLRDIEIAEKFIPRIGIMTEKGFVDNPNGPYKLFIESADCDKGYAVGADVAEGLATGDFSTMCGIDKNLTLAMTYKDHIGPGDFGHEMVKGCKFLRNALAAPEINNHGHTTFFAMKQLGWHHFYVRPVVEERSDEPTEKLCWQTNIKTKAVMLDEFVAAWRSGLFIIKDVEMLREMLLVVFNPDGTVTLNGRDLVVAGCIALQAIKQVIPSVLDAYIPVSRSEQKMIPFEQLLIEGREEAEETYFD
jgi:hypothetical protein